MAKRKKVIAAGRLRETVLYTQPEPRDSPRARAQKSKATSAAQKAANDKTARKRLEMLLAANFNGQDLFVTLTYRNENLPTNRVDAVKNVRAFLKALRKYRRLRGQQLTYVYVTEEKHGEGHFHHHLFINGTGRDIEEIKSLWAWGDMVDVELIGAREYDVWGQYATKESAEGRPVGAQMWTASKGLIKPKITTLYVPNDTALTVPAGCHVLEHDERQTEFGSYEYIKYRVPENYTE